MPVHTWVGQWCCAVACSEWEWKCRCRKAFSPPISIAQEPEKGKKKGIRVCVILG